MSYTNKTAHYNLPQYVADDKPTYLNDFNGAMSDIDSAIYAAKNAADQAGTDAKAAQSTASGNSTAITTLTQTVTDNAATAAAASKAAQDAADANTGSINTINSLLGKGEPTTTEKTIIGAINELNAKEPEQITVDNVLSTSSTNPVQNKIVAAAINANTASISENETHIENALNEIDAVQGQIEATDSTGATVKFQFGIDSDGNYGYKKAGADTVTPFKRGITLPDSTLWNVSSSGTITTEPLSATMAERVSKGYLFCNTAGTTYTHVTSITEEDNKRTITRITSTGNVTAESGAMDFTPGDLLILGFIEGISTINITFS